MQNDILRLVRVFHNLNRTQLAEKVGLSVSYISELESGSKKISLEVLQRYASAFKLPLSSLLLFGEKVESGDAVESARLVIGGKVVKMLNWVASISEDEEAGIRHVRKERSSSSPAPG
jgi:transcriptional regulator with XRE-family HTH domain